MQNQAQFIIYKKNERLRLVLYGVQLQQPP